MLGFGMRFPSIALLVPLLASPNGAPVVAPVHPITVVAPFRAPTSPFGPGHRGVDLAATPGQQIRSPIAGEVSFAGRVAGRDVVTVTDGTRTYSLEPVKTWALAGATVGLGEVIGTVDTGGHCTQSCIHVGLRINGTYVTPLRLRARLLR